MYIAIEQQLISAKSIEGARITEEHPQHQLPRTMSSTNTATVGSHAVEDGDNHAATTPVAHSTAPMVRRYFDLLGSPRT